MSEEDLLLRLQSGDHEAFEQLYRNYAPKLTAKLLPLIRDTELASDILQDLFVKVWQQRANIDPAKSFGGYLHTIAVNMVKDKFRRSLHQQIYLDSYLNVWNGYDSVSLFMDQKDIRKAIDHALSKLPPRQRQVYILHKLEGRSYKEIQEMLGITKSAVNRLIQEAGKKMREHLMPISYMLLFFILV